MPSYISSPTGGIHPEGSDPKGRDLFGVGARSRPCGSRVSAGKRFLLVTPAGGYGGGPEVVTPLIEPLTELTQKPPTRGKINKEFNATELRPRPNIQIPAGPPSTTRPRAALPAPPVPTPKPVQPRLFPSRPRWKPW